MENTFALILFLVFCASAQNTTNLCPLKTTCNSNRQTQACISQGICGSTCSQGACSTGTVCPINTTCNAGSCQTYCPDQQCINLTPLNVYATCTQGSCTNCTASSDCPLAATNCGATCTNGACVNGQDCTQQFGPYGICATIKGASQCVECTTSAQCSLKYSGMTNASICSTAMSNTCVGCLTRADCVTDTNCNSMCTNGQCTAGNLNCSASNQMCYTPPIGGSPSCVDCIYNSDCVTKLNKASAQCTNSMCQECVQDSDCATNTACNAVCNNTNQCSLPAGQNVTNCFAQGKVCAADVNGNLGCFECDPNSVNGDTQCPSYGKSYCVTANDAYYGTCQECDSGLVANYFCSSLFCGATCLTTNHTCNGGTGTCPTGTTCTFQNFNSYICTATTTGTSCGRYQNCTDPNFPFCAYGICSQCTPSTTLSPSPNTCASLPGYTCDSTCVSASGNSPYMCVNGTLTCNSNQTCAVLPAANDAVGACYQCVYDADCTNLGANYFCDPMSGTCFSPSSSICNNNNQCRNDTYCSSTCNLLTRTCNYNNSCNCTANDESAQICNIATGTCTECSTNLECSNASYPYCQASTGKCVQCLTNAECASPDNCNAYCRTGDYTCQPSVNPNNCVSKGLSCDWEGVAYNPSGYCYNCMSNSDCSASTPSCVLYPTPSGNARVNVGVCSQCITSTECQTDTTCNSICFSNNTCSSSTLDCTKNTNGLTHCDNTTSTCVQCVDSSQCSGNSYCFFGACVATCSCTTDTACDSICLGTSGVCSPGTMDCTQNSVNKKCSAGTASCVQCLVDSDCPSSTPFCGTKGACTVCRFSQYSALQGNLDCRSNSNCNSTCLLNTTSGDTYCTAGTGCSNVCDVNTGICEECTQDSNCPSGQRCDQFGKCVQCLADTDCNSNSTCGAHCNLNTYTCTGGVSCTANNQYCIYGRNVYGTNTYSCVQCLNADQCSAGVPCIANVCGLCYNDAQCRTNGNCNANCVNRQCTGGGTACSGNSPVCNPSTGTCGQCTTGMTSSSTSNCGATCNLATLTFNNNGLACSNGLSCINGVCKVATPATTGQGSSAEKIVFSVVLVFFAFVFSVLRR